MNAEITLDGAAVRIGFRLPETAEYYQNFITRRGCEGCDVRVAEGDPAAYPLICPDGVLTPYAENYLLIPRVCAFLLPRGRAVIHGASFLHGGRAWLITGQSGVGKTTQLRHWQRMFGDEIALIGGDKALLSRDGERFRLSPAPWTGKEGDRGTASGELAGIVLLAQGDHNAIRRVTPRESAVPLFGQLLLRPETEEEIRAAAAMLDALLRSVPVWRLDNLGDPDSAALTREMICEWEGCCHEAL